MRPARWLLPDPEPAGLAAFCDSVGVRPPAARVLLNRGYREPDAARRFLHPSMSDLHDPFRMAGMGAAVERLNRAISAGEAIKLYGDYDVDGITAVVILKKAIEMAGGSAGFVVPDRLREGYGMQAAAIRQAAAENVRLLISVDTGIRSVEAVRCAMEAGLDVIVTDHHLPEAQLPPALAVLNPNRQDCPYPEKNLCGAGVAFKFANALLGSRWPAERVSKVMQSFLKLVAIATVADVVPLTGENRAIVKLGLDGLVTIRNPGLKALLNVAGFSEGERPSAGQVAFRIAPRMNAAGRMANAADVIDLFLTADEGRARELAGQLHALNLERQQAETEIFRQILEGCERSPVTDSQAALVFAGEGWHRGVVGIVANRLVERFHRPAIVLSQDPATGLAQGSGRSVPGFHLLEALESMSELFSRFGGHRQAAGLTLAVERVPELRRRLNESALKSLSADDFLPVLKFDGSLELREINDLAVEEILSLAPFGCGNPSPLFALRSVEVSQNPTSWKERHLRIRFRQDGRVLRANAWNFQERSDEVARGTRLDAAIVFEEDSLSRRRGYQGWSAVVRDVRPSAAAAAAGQIFPI